MNYFEKNKDTRIGRGLDVWIRDRTQARIEDERFRTV